MAVFERVQEKEGPLDTIEKLGTYLKAIRDREERFTGRAIKNITDGVKMRAMDFELPDEWMENPDLFLRKDYETKKAMIQDMMVQEINRYADSEFRYSGTSDEAAISGQVREMRLLEEARRRYMEEKNAP